MSATKQIIATGDWSKSGKGNFTAYTDAGKQFFVPARMMESLGYKPGDTVTFPMFGFSATKKIGVFIPGTQDLQMEDDGVTPVQVDRDEITALFKDKTAFYEVANAARIMEVELHQHFKTAATASGLSEEEVSKLLEVSF